jgi:hypothetical protein
MSNTETKIISHLAFKLLDSIDIYGKGNLADLIPIVPKNGTKLAGTNSGAKILNVAAKLPHTQWVLSQELCEKTIHDYVDFIEDEILESASPIIEPLNTGDEILNYKSKIIFIPEQERNFMKKTNGNKIKIKCIKNGEVKKRVVTDCVGWNSVDSNSFDINNQYKLIEDKKTITNVVSRELRNKISSYKSQDIKKNIYNNDEFIDFEFVLNLFKCSQLKCYYCNKQVLVIYDNVRESRQWTIERIDNRLGHNKNNSVISCLDCNLRRRTMYHERYLMTKKLTIMKLSR